MEIIHENEYLYKMNNEIEPYLATHRQEGYVPGAEDHLHQKDTGIVGKIYVQRYLAACIHSLHSSDQFCVLCPLPDSALPDSTMGQNGLQYLLPSDSDRFLLPSEKYRIPVCYLC